MSVTFHISQLRPKYLRAVIIIVAALTILPRCGAGAVRPTITQAVFVGDSFTVSGSGFTASSVVNFFVATATGPVNFGPLKPSAHTTTSLTVPVPRSKVATLGQRVVSVVVNTNQGYSQSNSVTAQLFGSNSAGFPNLKTINEVGLAATSTDPSFATDNVEITVVQNHTVKRGGDGFDTLHGVAIDLFRDCIGSKIATIFLDPGNPGVTATALSFTVPADYLEQQGPAWMKKVSSKSLLLRLT